MGSGGGVKKKLCEKVTKDHRGGYFSPQMIFPPLLLRLNPLYKRPCDGHLQSDCIGGWGEVEGGKINLCKAICEIDLISSGEGWGGEVCGDGEGGQFH